MLSFRIRCVRHVFIHGDVDIYNIKFCCFHSVANRLRSSSQFTIAATGCTSVPNPAAQNRNLLTFVKTVQAFASFSTRFCSVRAIGSWNSNRIDNEEMWTFVESFEILIHFLCLSHFIVSYTSEISWYWERCVRVTFPKVSMKWESNQQRTFS